jgi:anti-anti-sigma factor
LSKRYSTTLVLVVFGCGLLAMTPNAFQLSELELEPGIREIAVAGELDLAVADRLTDAIDRAVDADTLVSLEACEFIDSSGLAVILRAHQLGRASGRRVVIHSPSKPVLRVLEVTGLTGKEFVFADRAAALAALVS